MTIISELIKRLQEALQPLNEQSSAYSDERNHRNIWVENPGTRFITLRKQSENEVRSGDKYFKYGDNESYTKETKCCGISMLKPNFLYHTNKHGVLDWALTESDKRELIKILNSSCDEHPEITVWQNILYTYNNDRFGMRYSIFIEDKWDDKDYPYAFRKDFPMLNYYQLQFEHKKAKNKIARR